MLVHPREQRRPRWATARGIVKLCEPQPVLRQLVKNWRLDLATVTPDIREPHVIGHDDHDIGLLSLGRRKRLGKSPRQREAKK